MKRRHEAKAPIDLAGWFVVGIPASASAPDLIWLNSTDVNCIQATDRFFDPAAFVMWSGSVYERAVHAWRDKDPEQLRPVMAPDVWARYAQFMLTVSALALGNKLMSSAVAISQLAGADATGTSQSATISFGVTLTAAAPPFIESRYRSWEERWLFQRTADSRTHVSGSVAVCMVCGGPADPADSGRCPYCLSDITTRTAGWLVTQVATTMPGVAKVGVAAGNTAPLAATPMQPPRAHPT